MLNATIKQHIKRYKEADPEFVEEFLRSIYVDDLGSGAPETNTGYELYLKSKLRLAEGGFNLRRKFVLNFPELTSRIQCNDSRNSDAGTFSKAAEPKNVQSPRACPGRNVVSEDKTYVKSMPGTIEEKTSSDSRVLGVRWNPMKDILIFDLAEIVN